jgi:hypothetical protein
VKLIERKADAATLAPLPFSIDDETIAPTVLIFMPVPESQARFNTWSATWLHRKEHRDSLTEQEGIPP